MRNDADLPEPQGLSPELLAALAESGLAGGEAAISIAGNGHARLDVQRDLRKGTPEVVLADSKTPELVVEIARSFVEGRGRVVLSRVPAASEAALRERLSDGVQVEFHAHARMMVITRPDFERPRTGGRVGVITAGTSDLPAAEEALVVAREMGCQVRLIVDVGVAGLHRLFTPLQAMLQEGVDAIVVAAGMDGALPSVVAGLVDVPVVGLPTSIGYGAGGRGVAALLSMLQSCAPGLVVVNIDNGVGAGATAALIANRVARYRGTSQAGEGRSTPGAG